MEEEKKELTLNEKVDMLLNHKEEPEKEEDKNKTWKLPFWKKIFKFNVGKKKVEKGWAQFIVIKNNRNLEFTRAQVKDGIAIIDGFPRVSTADHTLFYDKRPTYIIPEWSMKPFSPEENMEDTEKLKNAMAGRRAVLATLETEKIKSKKDFGGAIWIVVGIIIIGACYYFGKQYGWF